MIENYVDFIGKLILPVVLLLLGVWAKKIATNHEKRVSLDERIIEKRIKVYESIGADLNDIYVFLMQVGHWKELTPQDIIQKKRQIDKIMYMNRPYWSAEMFANYMRFIEAGFDAWNGYTEDAKIRTFPDQFQFLDGWSETWKSYFTQKSVDMDEVKQSYLSLIHAFSDEFGFIQKSKSQT